MTSGELLTMTIDRDALAHNMQQIVQRVAPARVIAVVKADGYNHGAVEAARVFLANGAAMVGVATIAEALELRRGGITAPILAWIWDAEDRAGLRAALAAGVELGIASAQHLGAVMEEVRGTAVTPRLTLMLDTGMSRSGFSPSTWDADLPMIVSAAKTRALTITGAMTHLACADEPAHPQNNQQKAQFESMLADLRAAGVACPVCHMANSPATLTRPDMRYQMVRPGVALYGMNPLEEGFFTQGAASADGSAAATDRVSDAESSGSVSDSATRGAGDAHSTQPDHDNTAFTSDIGWDRRPIDLRPAMTLSARVVTTRVIPAGASVSYGATWTAAEDVATAVVAMGYADGLPRALSGRMVVAINGRLFRQVGRVCMDQIIVVLGAAGSESAAAVKPGDEAIIFGAPGPAVPVPKVAGLDVPAVPSAPYSDRSSSDIAEDNAEVPSLPEEFRTLPTATSVARQWGTIHYEVLTSPHMRVRRRYVGRGIAAEGRIAVATAQETRDVAARLGALLQAGDLVVLDGPLGAGKTTFTQGLAVGLGVQGPVTSPTFTIARVHRPMEGTDARLRPAMVHVDAYRLLDENAGATDPMGALDSLDLDTDLMDAVVVAEWAADLAESFHQDYLEISIRRATGTDGALSPTGDGSGLDSIHEIGTVSEISTDGTSHVTAAQTEVVEISGISTDGTSQVVTTEDEVGKDASSSAPGDDSTADLPDWWDEDDWGSDGGADEFPVDEPRIISWRWVRRA